MQRCPNCGGGELKIIAAILERPVTEKTLNHLGLDPQPPARGAEEQAWAASSWLSRRRPVQRDVIGCRDGVRRTRRLGGAVRRVRATLQISG